MAKYVDPRVYKDETKVGKNTHRADKKNAGFTVCGLLITNKRSALIVSTMKAATCKVCGEMKGVSYYKTPAYFIKAIYPDPSLKDFTVDAGKYGISHLFVTKKGKCVVCTKDKKGYKRADTVEMLRVRLEYAEKLQRIEEKKNERRDNLEGR